VRHPFLLVRVGDTLDERALVGVSRHDRYLARGERRLRGLFAVEAQAHLAAVPIRAVAGVAVVGEDRTDILIKGDGQCLRPGGDGIRGGHLRHGNWSVSRRRPPDHGTFRPGRAFVDPPAQGVDLGGRERIGPPGHPLLRILHQQPLVEQAALPVPEYYGRARGSTL
jgi:hypothetical protein